MDLDRFVAAQATHYDTALAELTRGTKQSHWMWFIFPPIAGLGHSATARHYAIRDLAEARAYLRIRCSARAIWPASPRSTAIAAGRRTRSWAGSTP